MTTSRRDLLRGAALGGISIGALGACGRATTQGEHTAEATLSPEITTQSIAEAEKLQRITYTPAERAQLLENLETEIELTASVRAHRFSNDLAPALQFDPKLPGQSVGSQKNRLTVFQVPTQALPNNEDDIAFASVAQQGAWLRSGALTSRELTEIYLTRITQLDPKIRAYITLTPEIARAQAAKADDDFTKGRDRGPLHGIPYGLKDLADTKGVLTSWGATPYRDRIPENDSDVVRKLQRARAVMLGKTACGALAYGDQWFDARTNNPWNVEEGSSGSSAGSAAATAAGLCSFAIGTETLGSIVSPAERCGLAGLRPTYGRVSRHGFMALCWSLDKVGPICRYVEDTALVLSELNGYDVDDPGTARVGFSYDGKADLTGMKIGYVPKWFEDEGDNADVAALEAARALGASVEEFPWPEIEFDVLYDVVRIEAAAAFAELTLDNTDDELVWQEPMAWPNTFRGARLISAVDYVQMDRLRRKLMISMNAAFEGFDALIGPHYAGSALLATNMTGHPQLAFRSGFAQTPTRGLFDDSLTNETYRTPRGTSLWGPLFQDGNIIAIGRAIEASLGVADERPPGF